MSAASEETFLSCGVITIRGRRRLCQRPATKSARLVPARPEMTTLPSPRRVSEAMRRKSTARETRESAAGICLSDCLVWTSTVQDALDDTRRGLTFHEGQCDYLSSPPFDFFASNNVVYPIGPFDENIRPDCENHFERRVFIEGANVVNHAQRGKNLTAFNLWKHRTQGPFQAVHRVVGVNRNDQGVPESPRPGQQVQVAGMEDVEAAVGKNDFPAGGLEAADLPCDGITRMDRHSWNLQIGKYSIEVAPACSRRQRALGLTSSLHSGSPGCLRRPRFDKLFEGIPNHRFWRGLRPYRQHPAQPVA